MPFYLEGVQRVMSQVNDLLGQMDDLTVEGMEDIVLDIGSRAAEKAPVKEGHLRESVEVDVETKGSEIIGEIRFTEKYAAKQHEHVQYRHPKGGEAKYLEKAALEKVEQLKRKIGDKLEGLIGGL